MERKQMKRFRRVAVLVTVSLVTAGLLVGCNNDNPASASSATALNQGTGTTSDLSGEPRPFGPRIIEELDLTEDQQASVEAIMKKHHDAFRESNDPKSMTRQERRQAREQMREAMWEEIKTVLTEEQIAKVEERKAERERLRDATPEERVEHRVERLTELLTLSIEQQDQIRTIFLSHMGEFEAIRDSDMSRDERRETMQALGATVHEEIKAVLTPEQIETFDELRASRPHGRGDGGFGKRERM